MAYNPGIQYRGDQYLYEGTKAMGDNMAKAMDALAEVRAEDQFLGEAMQSLAKQRAQAGLGEVDPETMQRFYSGSIGAKRGIVSGLGAELNQYAHQQEEQRKAAAQAANMAYQGAIMDQMRVKAAREQDAAARMKAYSDEVAGLLSGEGLETGTNTMTGDSVINPLQDGTGLRPGELRQSGPSRGSPQGLTAQKMTELAVKHGVLNPGEAAGLMAHYAPKRDKTPQLATFNGHTYVYSPDTGAFEELKDRPVKVPDPVKIPEKLLVALNSDAANLRSYATKLEDEAESAESRKKILKSMAETREGMRKQIKSYRFGNHLDEKQEAELIKEYGLDETPTAKQATGSVNDPLGLRP